MSRPSRRVKVSPERGLEMYVGWKDEVREAIWEFKATGQSTKFEAFLNDKSVEELEYAFAGMEVLAGHVTQLRNLIGEVLAVRVGTPPSITLDKDGQ